MGLSARCAGSKIEPPPPRLQDKLLCGALCIVFDSESIGFAGALARVFQRVGAISTLHTVAQLVECLPKEKSVVGSKPT